MDRAMIVCDNEKGTQFYKSFLKENGIVDIITTDNEHKAKRLLSEYDFDICLINGPISGSSGENLSIDIAEKNTCQVIFLVKAEYLDEISARVEDYGIITVSKPINRQLLWQALKLAKVVRKRIGLAQKESARLEQKLADMKIISRAKLLLIVNTDVSEEEAHKIIEKQAMDSRKSRIEIAKEIIRKFEGD